MKFFKRIKHFLFGKPTEIEFVEAALKRYNARLNKMNDAWAENGTCCPNCMFGYEYTLLTDKIERVEKWLEI